MPKASFAKPEQPLFEQITGDYPFEVVGFDVTISQGNKTRGSSQMELKLKFFKDATFEQPVAQWTETLIFHPDTIWRVNQFALCANVQVNGRIIQEGDDVDYTDSEPEPGCVAVNPIGLRGWAKCLPRQGIKDPTKKFNSVQIFYTDKPKLERATEDPDDVPF